MVVEKVIQNVVNVAVTTAITVGGISAGTEN